MTTISIGNGDTRHKKRIAFGDDELSVTPLGAGCEVGRSCILVEFRGRSVMFDCGIHPAYSGIGALPIFDAVDVANIDLCLVTHFHLDHCGALPYFVAKTPFKGRIIMTEPTRAIANLLWMDYSSMAKLSSANSGREFTTASEYSGGGVNVNIAANNTVILFGPKDIEKTLSVIETIDFRQTLDFKDLGIAVTAYAAGHVLGACMFCVGIAGVNILYTGDYSREIDRHVPLAEIPNISVQVLICESTYGIRTHEPRPQREKRFLDSISKIISRKGKCLLPVFALGRAQELLLMLEEYWSSHHELHSVPIWYASPMSLRSTIVFETFISVCGDYVQRIAESGVNPFGFRFVKTARHLDDMRHDIYSDGRPCVVMAAPGMLQCGTSRALFELWCHDKRNGVILTGYSLKGTLADELKKSPNTLQLSSDKPSVKIDSSFEMISFSAHSDFAQSFEFIQALQCPNVVLVHGERNEAARLSDKLKELLPSLAVFCPEVLQKVKLSFPLKRHAKCLGQLALDVENMKSGIKLDALLVVSGDVTVDLLPILVSPGDAAQSADLPCSISQQTITCEYPHDTLQPLINRLSEIFERLEMIQYKLRVEDRVSVCILGQPGHRYLRLEWESDPLSDLIADTISFAVIDTAIHRDTLLSVVEGTADSVVEGYRKAEPEQRRETEEKLLIEKQRVIDEGDKDLLEIILKTLNDTYENVEVYNNKDTKNDQMISFNVPNLTLKTKERVTINFSQRQVFASEEVASRIKSLLRRLESPLLPLPPF